MSLENGWIKLHRKMERWEWYSDTNVVRLFLHLLLRANHKKKRWQGVDVMPGQLITGRKILSEKLNLSEQQIRTAMSKLKDTQEITSKATSKYSIITICNWASYQIESKSDNQQYPNEQPTDNQQITTNKNAENVKKYSEDSPAVKLSSLLLELMKANNEKTKTPDIQKWAVHIDRLIRIDKCTADEIEKVIRWSQSDKFWKTNILSTEKLRKQFPQLWAKSGNTIKPGQGNSPLFTKDDIK